MEASGRWMSSPYGSSSTLNSGTSMLPKATLICRPNSHPFQERTVILDRPVKIGRSVARVRPQVNNTIFDCKVLSRNHAILWYDNGKFYLQDTKSSNGTFVNNQQLGKGIETSPAKEVFSGDIIQFGVDVVENSRKVTHGCIIALLKLYMPDGKEAKSSTAAIVVASGPVSLEDVYKLSTCVMNALKKEQALEKKLNDLKTCLESTVITADNNWKSLIDEERLLTRIEILESQLLSGSKQYPEDNLREEVRFLLEDKNAYQDAAKELIGKLIEEKTDALTKAESIAKILEDTELRYKRLKEECEQNNSHIKDLLKKYSKQLVNVEKLNVKLQNTEEEQRTVLEIWESEKKIYLSKLNVIEKIEDVVNVNDAKNIEVPEKIEFDPTTNDGVKTCHEERFEDDIGFEAKDVDVPIEGDVPADSNISQDKLLKVDMSGPFVDYKYDVPLENSESIVTSTTKETDEFPERLHTFASSVPQIDPNIIEEVDAKKNISKCVNNADIEVSKSATPCDDMTEHSSEMLGLSVSDDTNRSEEAETKSDVADGSSDEDTVVSSSVSSSEDSDEYELENIDLNETSDDVLKLEHLLKISKEELISCKLEINDILDNRNRARQDSDYAFDRITDLTEKIRDYEGRIRVAEAIIDVHRKKLNLDVPGEEDPEQLIADVKDLKSRIKENKEKIYEWKRRAFVADQEIDKYSTSYNQAKIRVQRASDEVVSLEEQLERAKKEARSKSLNMQTVPPEVKLPEEMKLPVEVKFPADVNKEFDREFQMYIDSLKEALAANSQGESEQLDSNKLCLDTSSSVSKEVLLESPSFDVNIIPNNPQDQAKTIADLQKALKESLAQSKHADDLLDKGLKSSCDTHMSLLKKLAAEKDDITNNLQYMHKALLYNTFFPSEALRQEEIRKSYTHEFQNLPVETLLKRELLPVFKFFVYYHHAKIDDANRLERELTVLEKQHIALMAKKDKVEWDRDILRYKLNRAVRGDVFLWLIVLILLCVVLSCLPNMYWIF